MMLSEGDVEELRCLMEHLRDEARIELLGTVGRGDDAAAIMRAVAEVKVRQSNLVRRLMLTSGIPSLGPEWKIEGNRVVQV